MQFCSSYYQKMLNLVYAHRKIQSRQNKVIVGLVTELALKSDAPSLEEEPEAVVATEDEEAAKDPFFTCIDVKFRADD